MPAVLYHKMSFPITEGLTEGIEPALGQLARPCTIDRILATPPLKDRMWKRSLNQKFDLNEEKQKDEEKVIEEKRMEYARLSLPGIVKRVVEFDPTSSESIKHICGNDYSNFVVAQFKFKYLVSVLEGLRELGSSAPNSARRGLFSRERRNTFLEGFKSNFDFKQVAYDAVFSRLSARKFAKDYASESARGIEERAMEMSPEFIKRVLSMKDTTLEKVVRSELKRKKYAHKGEEFYQYFQKFPDSYIIPSFGFFESIRDILTQLDGVYLVHKFLSSGLGAERERLNEKANPYVILIEISTPAAKYKLVKKFNFFDEETIIEADVDSLPYEQFCTKMSKQGKHVNHYNIHYDKNGKKISPNAVVTEYVYERLKKAGLRIDHPNTEGSVLSMHIKGRVPSYLYYSSGSDNAGFFYATYGNRLSRKNLAYALHQFAIVMPVLGEALDKHKSLLKRAAVKQMEAK